MKHKYENEEISQAKQIVALLDAGLSSIDKKTISQLDYGRQQAVAHIASPANGVSLNHQGVLHLFGAYWHQHRMLMMTLLLSLILAMFVGFGHLGKQEATEYSDAYLLGSELPPEAYLNEGFDAWLSENAQ